MKDSNKEKEYIAPPITLLAEPNENKKQVLFLRELIETPEFLNSPYDDLFVLGRNEKGENIYQRLSKMVNLLISGATGGGKSIFLNTMLASLLYKSSPEDLKLILLDPKMINFSEFKKCPHMLFENPLMDFQKMMGALDYLIEEMNNRYKILGTQKCFNAIEYNNLPQIKNGELPKMPNILLVVDELSDMVYFDRKLFENKICQLLQKSRAVGIYIVLSTQRSTIDVITGPIKSNVVTKIAFRVCTQYDSIVSIDEIGAQDLMVGEMLYKSISNFKAEKIKGAYVSDKEIKTITDYLKENYQTSFENDPISEVQPQSYNEEDDKLLKQVLEHIVLFDNASVAFIQRKFNLGYKRAFDIVQRLENLGYITTVDLTTNKRKVLIDKENLKKITENDDVKLETYYSDIEDTIDEELENNFDEIFDEDDIDEFKEDIEDFIDEVDEFFETVVYDYEDYEKGFKNFEKMLEEFSNKLLECKKEIDKYEDDEADEVDEIDDEDPFKNLNETHMELLKELNYLKEEFENLKKTYVEIKSKHYEFKKDYERHKQVLLGAEKESCIEMFEELEESFDNLSLETNVFSGNYEGLESDFDNFDDDLDDFEEEVEDFK